jgi:chromosome segregation ATPase
VKLIIAIKMFGLKIVKSSYINTLKQDLDEAISYSSRLKRDYEDSRKKIMELEEKVRYLNTLVDSLNMDIDSKDSHIVKMGNELSKSRELYNESVKEKESLKRAYMDIEKKHKLSSKLLDEARRRYKELEDQNKAMSDRIKYLENHIDPEALDSDVPDEVVVDEDKMDPNSGHIDIPENNASEVTDADAGNDVNVENKAEDKKKSKKRKKTKKNE